MFLREEFSYSINDYGRKRLLTKKQVKCSSVIEPSENHSSKIIIKKPNRKLYFHLNFYKLNNESEKELDKLHLIYYFHSFNKSGLLLNFAGKDLRQLQQEIRIKSQSRMLITIFFIHINISVNLLTLSSIHLFVVI